MVYSIIDRPPSHQTPLLVKKSRFFLVILGAIVKRCLSNVPLMVNGAAEAISVILNVGHRKESVDYTVKMRCLSKLNGL